MNNKRSFYQNAAKTSWVLPLFCVGLMAVVNSILANKASSMSWMIMGVIYTLIILTGIISGAIGCFGLKKDGAKTTLVPGIIGLALNISIVTIILLIAIPSFSKYRSANNHLKMMQNMAAQANSQLPKMVDAQTQLEKVIVVDSKSLKYLFTFIEESKNDIDIEYFTNEMKIGLNNTYNTGNQLKLFRDNNIELIYEYYDKHGEFVTSVSTN